MTTRVRPVRTGVYAVDRFTREVAAAVRPAYVRAPSTGDETLDAFFRDVSEALRTTAGVSLRIVVTGREDVDRWCREITAYLA